MVEALIRIGSVLMLVAGTGTLVLSIICLLSARDAERGGGVIYLVTTFFLYAVGTVMQLVAEPVSRFVNERIDSFNSSETETAAPATGLLGEVSGLGSVLFIVLGMIPLLCLITVVVRWRGIDEED